ncbi:MAG: hypothetical protein RLZZ158_716 [Cyanobacteriota bacterium]
MKYIPHAKPTKMLQVRLTLKTKHIANHKSCQNLSLLIFQTVAKPEPSKISYLGKT